MSVIKIEDIAYVRFSAPDLAAMRQFLIEFGLVPFEAGDGRLYARGAGPSPFLHVTTKGDPAFLALGLRAESVEDLHRLAKAENAAVEPSSAPGGGYIVTLSDPDGCTIEVVAGQSHAAPLPLEKEQAHNSAYAKTRLRQTLRLRAGAATVMRLGHAVLEVKNFRVSEAWFKSRFGFITSDEIEAAPDFAVGAFMRCDRGDVPTDHHTLFLLQSPAAPKLNHAAFEVASFDDLMRGHTHLKAAHRNAAWGVGRHILGSQVFDYWKDPWGNELEHWTDGDLFTAADGSRVATVEDLLGVQWGPLHPLAAAAKGNMS
ncbi:MAG: VOC family protein [Alphaproteobacteria bacterium]|nr:VOC family protein [Alphaproteobacteria bacterium]